MTPWLVDRDSGPTLSPGLVATHRHTNQSSVPSSLLSSQHLGLRWSSPPFIYFRYLTFVEILKTSLMLLKIYWHGHLAQKMCILRCTKITFWSLIEPKPRNNPTDPTLDWSNQGTNPNMDQSNQGPIQPRIDPTKDLSNQIPMIPKTNPIKDKSNQFSQWPIQPRTNQTKDQSNQKPIIPRTGSTKNQSIIFFF